MGKKPDVIGLKSLIEFLETQTYFDINCDEDRIKIEEIIIRLRQYKELVEAELT